MKIKRQLRKKRNLRQIYFKRQKILLVEDNKINQMITKKMLENKGVTCEVIDNGEDAIEVAKNQSFDLI
jgi:CheY-like chemotaxis protein